MRRQRRVQGAWAKPRNVLPNTSTKPPTTKHQAEYGQEFVFKQPAKLTEQTQKPSNFSWVVPGVLAACAFPHTPSQLHYLKNEGITYLVSLTRHTPSAFMCPGMECFHIPVPEFTPPTLSQAKQFVNIVKKSQDENTAVAVHCQFGCGRTGTVLACYLADHLCLTADEAIREVRHLRPGSIETHQQEQLVHKYVNSKSS